MGREDWEVFEALRRERQETHADRRRAWAERLDALGHHRWTKHTDAHYQCMLLGTILDYWPGPKKWRWRGRTQTGDVLKFIEDQLKEMK